MKQHYEYTFVRIGERWLNGKSEAERDYQQIIHQHAREGWRLVQVFAPNPGSPDSERYFELIFERKIQEEAQTEG